ncbi:MAG TPA: ATP-binding protein [Bacteroidota bacterium]|nr:ATP-binding protein [Bacteroidota bacterium]
MKRRKPVRGKSGKPAAAKKMPGTAGRLRTRGISAPVKKAAPGRGKAGHDDQKRLAQLRLISEVTNRMSADLDLCDLLDIAASYIRKTFSYFDVTVFILTPDGKQLDLSAHAGNFTDFLPHGYQQDIRKGFIGRAARLGEVVICNDVRTRADYLAYEYHDTKSEIALPISIDGRVIGVLNVEDTKLNAFDETDALVLSTLSDQLGIAIKNARLYEEVRQANMKLIELDTMKSDFLGIVSHDFRSPLSSIMLAARSLLKNELIQGIPRAKEYMQLIVDQAVRLNQLAEDTLSITKIESGQMTYYFKIVNIERLIQDAVSMVRFSKRHDFEYSVDPAALFVKGDQTKLRQVVQNVVSNAVKYSPAGGSVRVDVRSHSTDEILITVSDQGMGVPADKLGKLFQKFSRVDSRESKEIKGAGLGLWICREVVSAHGGRIWMESKPGKGSTVKFIIRRAPEGS